ncbi:MAG: MFS transporter [Deltaproteobacteria bacterium]|uniref:MFS transporter n=1 Tax=Candidatus Desulfacyla euxinica TaxID=2841693 RepID=A0A8J6N3J1_9DELT|nr:MFS transporter [Candidatus Desulfacyla euxinica]MBL7217450.1 MFS transporter [Desulfobacteraceae bacterium]
MISKYFYGYNIVAAGFIIQAVSIGAMFTYGIFFIEFQSEFGWSRATISGASSLAFLITGAIGVLAGRLNDRIGPRVLIMASGISLGLAYMLMSRIQSPWQIYLLYGGLAGIGFSTHDVVTLSTVTRWFVKRRGMMSGIVKVGTGTGQFVVPLIVTILVAAYGWRNSYLIIGGVILVTLLSVAQMMRRDPQGMGLLPDDAGDEVSGAGNRDPEPDISLRAAARTSQFWIMCLSEFVTFLCLLTMIVHIIPHGTDIGLSLSTAAGVLSTIGGMSLLGRIVMGTANDRIGGKRSLIICYAVLICALTFLQTANQTWMLLLFAAIYGFAHGGFFTVMSPAIAELFGTGSHGAIFGVVLFSGMIGGAIGPLLTGRVFDVTGSYHTAFIFLIGAAIAGLILITFLRPLQGANERR